MTIQKVTILFSGSVSIQLKSVQTERLLNKPYVDEVTFTKGKDLPKKLVLDTISKNFVFLGTHLFKIYQILAQFYN